MGHRFNSSKFVEFVSSLKFVEFVSSKPGTFRCCHFGPQFGRVQTFVSPSAPATYKAPNVNALNIPPFIEGDALSGMARKSEIRRSKSETIPNGSSPAEAAKRKSGRPCLITGIRYSGSQWLYGHLGIRRRKTSIMDAVPRQDGGLCP